MLRGNFFSPPLYIQRQQFVIEFLKSSKPRSLLDLGCSECSLLRKVRFHRHGVEFMAGVDINSDSIQQNMYTLAPLMSEYLQPNARPLTIKLYQGSITELDPCTKGFDLITCMEVLEHLQLCEVERFSEVLFNYMEPRMVIISTPNAEFNHLLPGLSGFRHKDHKFEWSRAQFQTWAEAVSRKFGYSVEFSGVGKDPSERRDVGFCSQIGVFQRVVGNLNAQRNTRVQEPTVYKLLYRVEYPSLCDNNIFQRIVVSEVLYRAQRMKQEWMKGQDDEQCELLRLPESLRQDEELYRCGSWVCVPLQRLWSESTVQDLCRNIQELRDALQVDLKVRLDAERDAIMLPDSVEEEEEESGQGEKSEHPVWYVSDDAGEDWEREL